MIDMIRIASISFQQQGGVRGAAGMAYYTLFSLFPLLIVLVTIGTFFLDGADAISEISHLVAGFIPVSQKFMEVKLNPDSCDPKLSRASWSGSASVVRVQCFFNDGSSSDQRLAKNRAAQLF